MPFCQNCGNKLDDQAAFCPKCGTACGNVGSANTTEEFAKREQVFVGKIRKCPQCGAVLNTDAVTCPECGFDLGVKNIGNAVVEFQNQLRELDRKEAEYRRTPEGMIDFDFDGNRESGEDVFMGKKIRSLHQPSPLMIQKASLIQSVLVPHNKGEILEFLSIGKGALAPAQPGSYWHKIWSGFVRRCVEEGKLYYSDDAVFCAKLDSAVKNIPQQVDDVQNPLLDENDSSSEKNKNLVKKGCGIGCIAFFLLCLICFIISAALGLK